MRRFLRILPLIVITLLGAGPALSGDGELPSGGSTAGSVATQEPRDIGPPDGFDDTLQAILPASDPAAALLEVGELVELQDQNASPRPSEYLGGLTLGGKEDARLSVELTGAPTSELRAHASEVEDLWRTGRFDDALAVLRSLEDQGLVAGIGVGWQKPESAPDLKVGHVRIGTRTTGQEVALDYDLPTGNLFAVVNWGNAVGWSLHVSTNGGSSWSESYFWCCGVELVDLSVVDGFAYVAYVPSSPSFEARLRRHFATTGAEDVAYFFQTVVDVSPATLREIALASNADDLDDRIYYGVMASDNSVRFFWDEAWDGTTIAEVSPAVSNASRGLDMARNIGWPVLTGPDYLFLSYVGTDASIYVHRVDNFGWDGGTPVSTGQISADRTSISAYHDTALVAYEYASPTGQGAQYRITYDGGSGWATGSFAPAVGAGTFFDPLVTARSGSGTAMIYEQETGVMDTVFLQDRDGYAPGVWSLPVPVNELDFLTGAGDRFGFDWLGVGFGVAYIDWLGAVYCVVPGQIFSDGFESGDVSAWSSSVG